MYFYQKQIYFMKKKILFIVLAICTNFLYATKHEHIDENEVRYYKVNPLDIAIQQQLREYACY